MEDNEDKTETTTREELEATLRQLLAERGGEQGGMVQLGGVREAHQE